MNAHLHDLIDEAEARLDAAGRRKLAELVETFLATHEGPLDFTAEEMDRLQRLDSEPFAPAEPSDVAALFARRG